MKKYTIFFLITYIFLNSPFVYGQSKELLSRSQNTNQTEINSLKTQSVEFQDELNRINEIIIDIKHNQKATLDTFRTLMVGIQTIVAVAFGIVALLYGLTIFLQYRRELRESAKYDKEHRETLDILEKQRTSYEAFINKQEAKNDELLASTRGNIDQITNLLSALEDIFKFRGQTENIQAQLNEIEERRKQQVEARGKVIEEINRDAIQICLGITRYNYDSFENMQKFREFSIKLNASIQDFRLDEKELNASCFFILGLDFHLRNLYDNALNNLDKAITKSKLFASDGADIALYPDKTQDEIKKWNKKSANITLYYYAVLKYNLGDYEAAVKYLRNALDYDERDVKSMTYIPEAMFLGHLEKDFEKIVEEFDKTIFKIEGIKDTSGWKEEKNSILSQLYIAYGNCYFAKSTKEDYYKYRSLKKAIEKYEKAYELDTESFISRFSYAQALRARNKKTPNDQDRELFQDLFRKVFTQVKDIIAENREAKTLAMLYYVLVICCQEAQIQGENPKMYLMEIRKQVPYLPVKEKIKIFSPKTKIDLSCSDFIKEVEEYEGTL